MKFEKEGAESVTICGVGLIEELSASERTSELELLISVFEDRAVLWDKNDIPEMAAAYKELERSARKEFIKIHTEIQNGTF